MAEFEETCQRLGITLFVLPPRSPKLNGHEGVQRTFRDEFYTRPLPGRVRELKVELSTYLDYYNRRCFCRRQNKSWRPHMALGGLAPLEFLAKIREGSVSLESQMR